MSHNDLYRKSLDEWTASLRQAIAAIQVVILTCIQLPELGYVAEGRVTCHPAVLVRSARKEGCKMCNDRACTFTYQAGAYELCDSKLLVPNTIFHSLSSLECFQDKYVPPSTLSITTEYLKLEGVLNGFLEAFEIALAGKTKKPSSNPAAPAAAPAPAH